MRGALIVGLVLVMWEVGARGYEEAEDEEGRDEGRGGRGHSSPGPLSSPGAPVGADGPDPPDHADNSIGEYDDDVDSDVIPFAVWVRAAGRRCAGSLVRARAALTAGRCVRRAGPLADVTVGAAAGRDVTRAVRLALSADGALALLELSAALPPARPILHAGAGAAPGGCDAPCRVARGAAPGRVRSLAAPRADHCPAALGARAGTFCLHPVTLCQNDTGTGVTCGGKLCGVVVHSAPPPAPGAGAPTGTAPDTGTDTDTGSGTDTGTDTEADSCSESHEAAALSHWKHFMRCALDERSCHGDCQPHCTEYFFNIEGTTWANDKTPNNDDVSIEGGRPTPQPGPAAPAGHSAGGRAHYPHYPHNAYHPPAPTDMAIPETNTSHLVAEMTEEHRRTGAGGGWQRGAGEAGGGPAALPLHVAPLIHPQAGEIKELDMPRPKAIPSMTREIPWTGDLEEAAAGAPAGDYGPSPSPAPAPSLFPPPPATEFPPPPPAPAAGNTTTRPPFKAADTKIQPGVTVSPRPPTPAPAPPAPPPAAPPRPPQPLPPAHVSPGMNMKNMEHTITTFRPQSTELAFPSQTKSQKPHQYTNQTRRITTEEYRQFDEGDRLQATANESSKGTLGSQFATPLVLAVLLTLDTRGLLIKLLAISSLDLTFLCRPKTLESFRID